MGWKIGRRDYLGQESGRLSSARRELPTRSIHSSWWPSKTRRTRTSLESYQRAALAWSFQWAGSLSASPLLIIHPPKGPYRVTLASWLIYRTKTGKPPQGRRACPSWERRGAGSWRELLIMVALGLQQRAELGTHYIRRADWAPTMFCLPELCRGAQIRERAQRDWHPVCLLMGPLIHRATESVVA